MKRKQQQDTSPPTSTALQPAEQRASLEDEDAISCTQLSSQLSQDVSWKDNPIFDQAYAIICDEGPHTLEELATKLPVPLTDLRQAVLQLVKSCWVLQTDDGAYSKL